MSYAGTYGPDQTCEHDVYRPNCWLCNGSVERFVTEYPQRMRHERAVLATLRVDDPITARVVTVFDVSCPGCDLRRTFSLIAEAHEWWHKHAQHVRAVAKDWRNSPEELAEAARRGLHIREDLEPEDAA